MTPRTRMGTRAVVLALSFAWTGCSNNPSADAVDASTDAATEPLAEGGGAVDAAHDALLVRDAGGPGAPVGPRDRAGRAFVTKLLVSEANRDAYNQSPAPFVLVPRTRGADASSTAEDDVTASLARLDSLDGKIDWPVPDGGAHPLAALVLTDVLVVDPRRPFAPTGYLDVESTGATHATSGGRPLSDDALDKTLSFFVTGQLSGVSDGVAVASKPPSRTFPYLAPPH